MRQSVLLHSGDGKNWNPIGPGCCFTSVTGNGNGDVWAVGGDIIHSIDDGMNWRTETGEEAQTLISGVSARGNDVFAVQYTDILHNYVGGGTNWTLIQHPQNSGYLAIWVGPGVQLFLAGDAVYSSTDQGNSTTTLLPADPMNGVEWRGIVGVGQAELYVVGQGADPNANNEYDAFLAHSTNGGLAWVQKQLHDPQNHQGLMGVWASNPKDVWAVGWPQLILHSTDGGNTWQEQQVPLAFDSQTVFNAVWSSGPGNVYVVGAIGGSNGPGVILHLE